MFKAPDFSGMDPAVRSFVMISIAAGYLMGASHPRLVTCEDFAISGQYVPENCQPEKGRERLFR